MKLFKSNSIIQIFLGAGKNSVNYNQVVTGLMPENLKDLTERVFTELRKGNRNKARKDIIEIETTHSNEVTKPYLNFLKTLTNLVDKEQYRSTETELTRAYAEARECDKGIILAGLIRIKIALKEIDEAKKVYEQKTIHSPIAECQYFEFLADKEELDDKINDPLLDNKLAISILYGYMRLEEHELCFEKAIELNKKYDDYEFKVALLLAKSNAVSEQIHGKQYWSISRSCKNSINEIIEAGYDLSKELNGEDVRIFSFLVPYLIYKDEGKSEQIIYCHQYVERWRNLYPEYANFLDFAVSGDIDKLQDSEIKEFHEHRKNNGKKEELKEKLNNGEALSINECYTTSQLFENELIYKWLSRDGEVINNYHSEVINNDTISKVAYLLLATRFKGEKGINLYSKITDTLNGLTKELEKNSDLLKDVNSKCILEICQNLGVLNLDTYACTMLSNTLDEGEPWLSPLMEVYISILFNCNQYDLLIKLIDRLENDSLSNESFYYWNVRSNINFKKGLMCNALNDINKALYIEPFSSYALYLKLEILLADNKQDEILPFFESIDVNVFNITDKNSLYLLSALTVHVPFDRIESIILNLFILNPYKTYKYINSHYLHFFMEGKLQRSIMSQNSVGNVLKAVRYKKGNDEIISLIVKEGTPFENTSYVIEEGGIYSDILLQMNAGETNNEPMHSVKLLEVMPPYVALFKITSLLRNQLNDGSDSFVMLEAPKNPEELLDFFQNLAEKMTKQDKIAFNTLDNERIPVLCVAHMHQSDSPIDGILKLITSPDFTIPTPKPVALKKETHEILLDAYSATYIALCGLSKKIQSYQVFLTNKTERIIKEYIKNIKDKSYFNEQIKGIVPATYILDSFVEELKLLLVNSSILDDKVIYSFDAPKELSMLKDKIDNSVYQTILLSACKNITWLTFDFTLPSLMYKLNIKCENVYSLALEITQPLPLQDRIKGLSLSAYYCLPFPIRNGDIFNLTLGFKLENLKILLKLFENNTTVFSNTPLAIYALADLFVVLVKKLSYSSLTTNKFNYSKLEINKKTVIESILNIILRIQIKSKLTNDSAETKLSKFIYRVLLKSPPNIVYLNMANYTYGKFIEGHFLSQNAIEQCYVELTQHLAFIGRQEPHVLQTQAPTRHK